MRRSYHPSFVEYEGVIAGIDFSADYCAEHEWGIQGISDAFGINQNEFGIKRYQIAKIPSSPCTLEKVKFTDGKMPWIGLYFNSEPHYFREPIPTKKLLPRPYKHTEDEICTAWDKKSFGLVVHKKNEWFIDAIMTAIQNNDLAIGIAPGHVFKNGGLKLLIVSKLPQEVLDAIMADHIDYDKLNKAVDKTRIVKYLERHNKKYYALQPSWYDPNFKPNNRTLNTKYKVIFFLNPHEQSKYNCGWYTVEELKDWGKDKGIIMK